MLERSVYCIIITDHFFPFFSVCFLEVGKGLKWASNTLKSSNKYHSKKKGHAEFVAKCTCVPDYVGVAGEIMRGSAPEQKKPHKTVRNLLMLEKR